MMCSTQILLKAAFAAVILTSLSDLACAQIVTRAAVTEDGTVPPAPTSTGSYGGGANGSPIDLPSSDDEPDFLQTLPHPPVQPQSLFQPAPPLGPPPPDLEQPYFAMDSILDPPHWGQPGWFADIQVAPVFATVSNQMQENVLMSGGKTFNVNLGSAKLGWTVAPRAEVGYRLPSGFGEFSIADTGFTTNRSQLFSGPDGPASRSSSLTINYTDFDYHSREYTPLGNFEMKWRAGMRIMETSNSTTFNQPFAQAAAGSQVFSAKESNSAFGFGPHFALELERPFGNTGFSLVGKIDMGDNYSLIRQTFNVASTSSGSGVQVDNFTNQVIILTSQLGLAWKRPCNPSCSFYMGYVEETWFNVMANENVLSQGQFLYHGAVLRAAWNY